jgi:pentatricopeptide repeat protein
LDLAFASLALVIKTGWIPNVISYNTLLDGLCKEKRTDDAMDVVLRRMPELSCTPNVFSYNTLLNGLCKEKRTDDAMDVVLRRMPELGCAPDVISYNTLLNGLCKEERTLEALDLCNIRGFDLNSKLSISKKLELKLSARESYKSVFLFLPPNS